MSNEQILQELIDKHPAEWDSVRKAFRLLKLRSIFLYLGGALGLIAVALYFLVPGDSWEFAIIPGILAIGIFYFVLFRLKNQSRVVSEASSGLIPLMIHMKGWNLEYEYSKKPYIREFKSSLLYPYRLTKLQGYHFFSGIARNLPFLAWFVEASYRDKVGESALSMASTSSEFNGFNGFEIMVKNLRPDQKGIVAIQKSKEEDIAELNSIFQNDQNWKAMKTDDVNIRNSFYVYTKVANPATTINQWVINKLGKIKSLNTQPVALSFKSNTIYLHQYFADDPFSFDIKKSLKENIKTIIKSLDKLVEISHFVSLP
jgi:hypothetical protein